MKSIWVASCLALAGLGWTAPAQIPQPIPRPIPKPRPKTAPTPAPRTQPKPAPRPRVRPRARPAGSSNPALPQAVQGYLASVCARAGGRLGNAAASVVALDFTGDGLRDYFVDQRNVRCTGATRPQRDGALFEASLFVALGAAAQQAALARVANATVDRSGPLPSLWLESAGADCGNVPAGQRCRNRLIWSRSEGRMLFTDRQYLDAVGRVIAAPLWPAIDPSIPAAFAEGTLQLKKKGGCSRFYVGNGRAKIAESVNSADWNGAVRSVIDHGCSTDIAWFVLGFAAEKFGKPDAARRYYVEAGVLTRKPSLSNIYRVCARVSVPNPCLGMDVANSTAQALSRLGSVK